MQFTTRQVDTLPRLAWLVEADPARRCAQLLHGPWVEVHDGFFMEGVWNGSFTADALRSSDAVFGTGAVLLPDGMVFLSSSTTTDYLFYQHAGQQLVVSNSLPLLLAHANDTLDPHYAGYAADCDTIKLGIDAYRSTIPTCAGNVQRLMFRNLLLRAGQITLEDKPMCPPFQTYDDYVDFLRANYRQLALNARDAARRQPLSILSTQSKGYDSTAVNALAAPLGVDLAFTISQSKGKGAFADRDVASQDDDDGREIARQLGMPCIAIERRQFEGGLADEHLFFAGVANSEDLNFAGFLPHIDRPSMLLTGTLGELYYPQIKQLEFLDGQPPGPELRRGDLGGHGLAEVRLKTGFVQLAFIYLGAQQRASITAITDSPAMNPWRLNTAYDRPIPRRIAEEAGVARNSFGQKKMATTVSYARPNIPHHPALRRDFFAFLSETGLRRAWQLPLFRWVHWYNTRVWFANGKCFLWFYYLSRAHQKLTGRSLGLLWMDLGSALYCFSVNRCAAEYKQVLDKAQLPVMSAAASNSTHSAQ